MPLDRETEVENLSLADRHIADAERQITKQTLIRDRLRADGHDTKEADRMLASFVEILETLYAHRALILDVIRAIDDGRV